MAATRCVFVLWLLLVGTTYYVVRSHSFTGWQDYVAAWELSNIQRAGRMYPYGPEYLDSEATVEQRRMGFDPGLTFTVPYHGIFYQAIYISIHGHVAFDLNKPASPVDPSMAMWPNTFYPQTPDPPFIAPFYAKSDLRVSDPFEPSQIYHRMLARESTLDADAQIAQGMLDEISGHVREAVVGADVFTASHGVIITWSMLTFTGSPCHTTQLLDNCYRNTFQMALVTDEVSTHVVLNYYNVTWMGGSEQGCDPYTGKKSDAFPNCQPAQAGFNAGLARGFTPLPYSYMPQIVDLDTKSGSLTQGRYFFQVDGSHIHRGGCTDDISLGSSVWNLEVFPQSDSMLGGHEVNVSGPCFKNTDSILCRFNDVTTNGLAKQTAMRATCRVPVMKAIGPVSLSVSIDGGSNYYFTTQFISSHMGHVERKASVTPLDGDWLNGRQIQVTWSPHHLTWKSDQSVEVRVHGYTETKSGESNLVFLQSIMEGVDNKGHFTIFPKEEFCSGLNAETKCTSYDVGLIEVLLQDANTQTPMRLWSDPIPLGWFTKDQMKKTLGSDWPHQRCLRWHSEELKQGNWRQSLWRCPCMLHQALADFGRFLPDPYCDMNLPNARSCDMHDGAVHCVTSSRVSLQGGGTQCCYGGSGELMYSWDSAQGSRPARHHPWGKPPYTAAGSVPSLSNWVTDLAPYYYCCVYQPASDNDCYTMFVAQRVTEDCKEYQVPGTAATFGDPHFKTFDGTVYTFNGAGEFWLVKAVDVSTDDGVVGFELQARLEPVTTSTGNPGKASRVTSIVMRQQGLPSLEAKLMSDHASEKIHLWMDGERLEFPDKESKYRHYNGLVVINTDAAGSVMRSNFTIVYRCGVGVQVAHKSGLLHVVVSLPSEFKTHTQGLLGDWDGDGSDDLQPQGGDMAVPSDDLERIHNFGWTWAVTGTESLFYYVAQLTYQHFRNELFIPVFSYPVGGVYPVCGDNSLCRYDFVATGSEAVAADTVQAQQWTGELATMARHVPTCGWLPVRFGVKQQPVSYIVGSVVNLVECRDGFELEGSTRRYECVDTGDGQVSWLPQLDAHCKDTSGVAVGETKLAVVVAIPAGIVFILLFIALVACICCIRKRNRLKDQREMEKFRPDTVANDEFLSDFHDVKSTPMRPPRPAYRSPHVPNVSSVPGDTERHLYAQRAKSTDNLDRQPAVSLHSLPSTLSCDRPDHAMVMKYKVFPEDCLEPSVQTMKRRPYEYPQSATLVDAERKRPPYRYPRSYEGLTDDERAIIEANAKEYSFDEDYNV